MLRKISIAAISTLFLLNSNSVFAVPPVTGEPIIVQHLGKVDWPQEDAVSTPYLTQLAANDINDLHGDLTCDLIITTPGNYHMALRDAMKGRTDLGHVGLQKQASALNISVCWSTSPPVGPQQIQAEDLQFKNIHVTGRPALAMGPGKVMKKMIAKGLVDKKSSKAFMKNRGNVILVRADKKDDIKNICDLGGDLRVATPHPKLEKGSFGNFSGTIYNVAKKNKLGCDADKLFNGIFSQNASRIDTSAFANPYDIEDVLDVFEDDVKWVASSRIMHRDIPYALCHNEADAAVIFYHQARYLKKTLGKTACKLEIVPMGGTEVAPAPMSGNKVGKLFIAKVKGKFSPKVKKARDLVYNFMTTSPIWKTILNEHGMDFPK